MRKTNSLEYPTLTYDLDDVWIVPRHISTIKSRKDVDISNKLGSLFLKIPIIASPMRDVVGFKSSVEIIRCGGLPIIHRFNSIDEQIELFLNIKKETSSSNIGCAVGIDMNSCARFDKLYSVGCRLFCIDVANGANTNVYHVIDKLSKTYDAELIVGNIASKEAFEFLSTNKNVVGIRVGIAGGKACTTKYATGIYYPMASLLEEIADYCKNKEHPAIIADGGISSVANFCKAIGLGADFCMMGNLIASTKESPAEIIEQDSKQYKIYHGSASFHIQKTYKDNPRFIEGTRKLLEFNGETIEELFNKIEDGLRSSLSYMNANNIKEFQNNVEFCT